MAVAPRSRRITSLPAIRVPQIVPRPNLQVTSYRIWCWRDADALAGCYGSSSGFGIPDVNRPYFGHGLRLVYDLLHSKLSRYGEWHVTRMTNIYSKSFGMAVTFLQGRRARLPQHPTGLYIRQPPTPVVYLAIQGGLLRLLWRSNRVLTLRVLCLAHSGAAFTIAPLVVLSRAGLLPELLCEVVRFFVTEGRRQSVSCTRLSIRLHNLHLK